MLRSKEEVTMNNKWHSKKILLLFLLACSISRPLQALEWSFKDLAGTLAHKIQTYQVALTISGLAILCGFLAYACDQKKDEIEKMGKEQPQKLNASITESDGKRDQKTQQQESSAPQILSTQATQEHANLQQQKIKKKEELRKLQEAQQSREDQTTFRHKGILLRNSMHAVAVPKIILWHTKRYFRAWHQKNSQENALRKIVYFPLKRHLKLLQQKSKALTPKRANANAKGKAASATPSELSARETPLQAITELLHHLLDTRPYSNRAFIEFGKSGANE